MNQVIRALDDVKDLYRKVLGTPAPEIQPISYASFPPGVDPLDHAIQEVEQLRKLSEQMQFAPHPASWVPPADTSMTDDVYVIRVELCGVPREELKVFVAGGECIVRGDRKPPSESTEVPVAVERGWGPFERRFALPQDCRADEVSARYRDGVLEVRIDREKRRTPAETKIEVA